MKIKFEYRGDWMEYCDWTIEIEELKDICDSVADEEEFTEYIIDSADTGNKEFGVGEHDIIKIYEEAENLIPEEYIKVNGELSENPEWTTWREQQGKSGLQVNFEISKFRDFSFLLDLDCKKIMTEVEEKERIQQESKKDGVAVQVNLHHRGVVRYTSTEINDKKFNPELFTIQKEKMGGEYGLNFYYNNELLTVDREDIESDGEGSEWSVFSRGIIDEDEVRNILEGMEDEPIAEDKVEDEEVTEDEILERIEAERREIMKIELRVDFTNIEESWNNHENKYYYQGELFTGTFFELYPNGKLKREVQTLLGQEHGIVKVWYENGVLSFENTFNRGYRFGKLKSWDKDGILEPLY